MIGPRLKEVVVRDVGRILGQREALLMESYLDMSSERVPPSVWVDLMVRARDDSALSRMDPSGSIRSALEKGEAAKFQDWWHTEAAVPGPDDPVQMALF